MYNQTKSYQTRMTCFCVTETHYMHNIIGKTVTIRLNCQEMFTKGKLFTSRMYNVLFGVTDWVQYSPSSSPPAIYVTLRTLKKCGAVSLALDGISRSRTTVSDPCLEHWLIIDFWQSSHPIQNELDYSL